MQEHLWLQHYPPSMPAVINPDQYESLVDWLEDIISRYKKLPMFENMGKVLTYADIDQLSRAFAAYLQNHTDLKPGDHVAIQLPNLLQYPIAMLGVLRAGMAVVNINPLYTPYEMEYQLRDSAAKAIIILANFAHNLMPIVEKTAIKTVIVTKVGDMLGKVKGTLVNWAAKHIKKLVPPYHLQHSVSFNQVLALGKKASFTRPQITNDQIAFLQYTGGTTGISKGTVLTHRNMLANLEQMAAFIVTKLQIGKEIIITPLPLYHIFALTVNLLAMAHIGAKNVLITNPRDLRSFIQELKKHPFTCIIGVNTLFNSLLNQEQFRELDFSHLKISLAGGMALRESVAKKWEEVTGVFLIEGYGLTEAAPSLICNLPSGPNQLGTVGIPLPSTIIKIVDDAGNELPPGEPGNLLVQGPQVMKGYWNKPLETVQVLKDGWLHTGDIALMNPDGYVKIVDRKKEMINVSGFNVYPNEIENVVITHPQVLEAGVIGVLETDGRESVKLFVVSKNPTLKAEELIAYCKLYLTKYKVPRYVEFRDSLPKSPVGKVLRKTLQEEENNKKKVNSLVEVPVMDEVGFISTPTSWQK
jgi:long-chain acyl-CoA synthetase